MNVSVPPGVRKVRPASSAFTASFISRSLVLTDRAPKPRDRMSTHLPFAEEGVGSGLTM